MHTLFHIITGHIDLYRIRNYLIMKKVAYWLMPMFIAVSILTVQPEITYAQATVATDDRINDDDDDDDTGKWGLVGLLGLIGLAGLRRNDRDDIRRTRTTNVS